MGVRATAAGEGTAGTAGYGTGFGAVVVVVVVVVVTDGFGSFLPRENSAAVAAAPVAAPATTASVILDMLDTMVLGSEGGASLRGSRGLRQLVQVLPMSPRDQMGSRRVRIVSDAFTVGLMVRQRLLRREVICIAVRRRNRLARALQASLAYW
jgi:hypothetical protein